jgi:hypothetical protein
VSATRASLTFAALLGLGAGTLFLVMRDHGFHPTDDGFIFAYSYRVLNGEVPYRDFVFERTPLTVYAHAAWLLLPDGWQIQAGRLAFYVEMALSALVMTVWAVSRGLRPNLMTGTIVVGALLIALHNFPPMPWPTVDGVFLAAVGSAAFLAWRDGRSLRWLALSSTALTLAVFAKQSFAPLVILVVLYAVVAGARASGRRGMAAALTPPALLVSAVVAYLVATGALDDFLFQIAQPTQMRPTATNPWTGDLVVVGLRPYLVALTPAFALPLIAVAAAYFWRDRATVAWLSPLIPLGVLLVAAVLLPAETYASGFVIFYACAMLAIAEAVRVARGGTAVAPLAAYPVVLLAAWCASLSFAYQSPILACGVIGPILALAVPPRPMRLASAIAGATLAFVATVSLLLNLELPYRDSPRAELTADLYEIYPRFGHLYTNEENAARHRELRDASTRFALEPGRDFVVLISFPLAHFLTRTHNPVSVDWLEPQEYFGNEDRLRRELDASRPVLIVQRQFGSAVGVGPDPVSCARAAAAMPAFVSTLLGRSALAFEGTHFCVYVP